MNNSYVDRGKIKEVINFVDIAYGKKVCRGGLEDALHALQSAENLLFEGCEDVWRHEIDYRQAHIYMRLAGICNIKGDSEKAKEFFRIAYNKFSNIKNGIYEHHAAVYKIPAGINCGLLSANDAVELMKNFDKDSPEIHLKNYNKNLYNLYELSCYYGGIWNNNLDGIMLNCDRDDSYTILSNFDTNNFNEKINVTKNFAYQEINQLKNKSKIDGFVFLHDKNANKYEFKIQDDTNITNEPAIRYLFSEIYRKNFNTNIIDWYHEYTSGSTDLVELRKQDKRRLKGQIEWNSKQDKNLPGKWLIAYPRGYKFIINP